MCSNFISESLTADRSADVSYSVVKVGRNLVPGPHENFTLRSWTFKFLRQLLFFAAKTPFRGLESQDSVGDRSHLVSLLTYLLIFTKRNHSSNGYNDDQQSQWENGNF